MSVPRGRRAFDVRTAWIRFDELWDENRKDNFLLRCDVAGVLSIDTLVWPSALSDSAVGADGAPVHIGGPEIPEYVGPDGPLWEDLEALRRFVAKNQARIRRPYEIIAFSGLGGACNDLEPREWTFLGFDVSDDGGISGLSNCGFTREDRDAMKDHGFSPALNQWHLFTSLDAAEAFSEYSDTRVREHAPFRVITVHRVERVESSPPRG